MLFPFFRSNLFFKDKVILINLGLSLVPWFFSLVWLYFKIEPQVEPVALRYTVYFGIDLIGPWWYVYLIPLIGFITLVINFSLAYLTYLSNKILAQLIMLASAIIQVLLVILSILIHLLNR